MTNADTNFSKEITNSDINYGNEMTNADRQGDE